MVLSILLCLWLSNGVIAFTQYAASRRRRTPHTPGWTLHTRKATVYAPSWEDGYSSSEDDDVDPFGFGESNEQATKLAGYLSTQAVAALARLAAAFCPTGGLDVRSIDHVQVLSLDENHIDIQAAVREGESCVTLAVPIDFPHPCLVDDGSEELEACVMDNIVELDGEAVKVLRKIEWETEHHEEIEAAERQLQVLRSTEDLHFPGWWLRPQDVVNAADSYSSSATDDGAAATATATVTLKGTRSSVAAMIAECDSIRNLLNEAGFQPEVRALASQQVARHQEYHSDADHLDHYYDDNWSVDQAAVAAVGPAGLMIRAKLHKIEVPLFDFEESGNANGNGKVDIVEIPISFRGGATATDVESLRSSVLGLAAAAADFVDED